ncbi:hypothetical protein [Streptomyces liliifuscus]|uniref:Uncharacterized protein n=1 Tax=Streptomyces liliifuscus TaxID=2797636 RepID=A0A7T7KY11_9ACTN|nr:hypothetical protein [Streptomyces liliifuscus]QQM42815.1 hypothetical protein JEQ17_27595 [Streptomyces liliifuscus]
MLQPDLTPEQAQERLETARTEAAEAAALIEELAERVREGEDVTAEQLGAQRQLADLASLRVTAAERKLADAVKADRHARCTKAVEDARSLLDADDTAPIVDAVVTIREGVARLVDEVNARNARIDSAGSKLEALNGELSKAAGTLDDPGAWPLFDRYRARGDRRHITMRDPERGQGSVSSLSSIDLACAALLTTLSGDPNTVHLGARLPMPDSVVRQLGEKIPGLADAWRATPEEWAQARNTTAQTRGSQQGREPLREDVEG